MEALNEISLPTVLVTVAAVLSPYLTAVFTRTGMSPKVKNIISAVVSVVLALGYTVLKGDVSNWQQFWTAAPAIYATSQLMYTLFLKGSAKKVEENVGLVSKGSVQDGVVITQDLPPEDEEVTADDLVVSKIDETPAKG